MANKVITATEFRAKALALLDEVETNGGTITITKRGRPVATLGPPSEKPLGWSMGSLEGKVQILGDIVNVDFSDLFECLREE